MLCSDDCSKIIKIFTNHDVSDLFMPSKSWKSIWHRHSNISCVLFFVLFFFFFVRKIKSKVSHFLVHYFTII